jgi:mRNA interferase YafO
MDIRIFTHKALRIAEQERGRLGELEQLVREFGEYKRTGQPGQIFGRDEPYDRPSSVLAAEVKHVHLRDEKSHPNWLRIVQFRRTSDSCLVYCQGEHSKDNYLIMAVLRYNPVSGLGAHDRTKKTTFMLELADIAEGFRKIF